MAAAGALRVVIDGRALHDDSRYRGMGTHLRHLLAALAGVRGLEVAVLATETGDIPHGVERVQMARAAPPRFRLLEHWWRLPRDVRRARPDVVHTPANQPLRSSRTPWVHTIHDVIPLLFDDPEFRFGRARWHSWRRRLRQADAVIAVSAAAAGDAVRLLDLDPARVHVAPNGVDPDFSPGPVEPVDSPYLLYVGEYGPHKGYREALDLVARLAGAGRPHRLKMIGRLAPWAQEGMGDVMRRAAVPDRVDQLGFVSRAELKRLYRGATALVVTSRYEGFGLPALEAMASGTPVVSFANSALTETVGDGGVLVPDGDVAAMADSVNQLIDSPARRSEVVAAGARHVKAYTWERCAAVHARVYRQVAGLPPAGDADG